MKFRKVKVILINLAPADIAPAYLLATHQIALAVKDIFLLISIKNVPEVRTAHVPFFWWIKHPSFARLTPRSGGFPLGTPTR